MAKKPEPEVKREPIASFEVPAGLKDENLGLSSNRTINAWALDRVLGYFGAHSVEIIDSIAMSPDGRYAELVRDGDHLHLYGKL